MRFKDKVIWITGASSGIGESLAYAFSREGAKLILSGRRPAELERVKAACAGPAENILIIPLDLSQYRLLEEKAAEAESRFGRVDILVNNGGISQRSRVQETDLAVDEAIMNTNYFGAIALTKAVLPGMLSRESGHIVVISSLMGFLALPMRSAYAASKHALHGYFDCMRMDMHKRGIKVTVVCPGFIKTNISINALTGDGTTHKKMDAGQARGMDSDECARLILKAVARGKDQVLIGGWEVLGVYARRLLPSFYKYLVTRMATSRKK